MKNQDVKLNEHMNIGVKFYDDILSMGCIVEKVHDRTYTEGICLHQSCKVLPRSLDDVSLTSDVLFFLKE